MLVYLLTLTLLLSALISVIAYRVYFSIIKEKVSSSFSMTLDYVSNSVYSELKQIHRLADYLFVNNSIKDAIMEGKHNTKESLLLNTEAVNIIKQYAISHIFENINSITISGFNGYYLNYPLGYTDVAPDRTQINKKQWNKLVVENSGEYVWIGLSSRPMNPSRPDSPFIYDVILLRSIRNRQYSEDIGLMCISVNTRAFTKLIQTYDINYPDFAGRCSIYILDNNNNIIDSSGYIHLSSQISNILNSPEAYKPNGYYMSDQNYIAFVRPVSKEGWKVIGIIPMSTVAVDKAYIISIGIISLILSVFVSSLTWLYISLSIFKPLNNLALTMKRIEAGDTSLRVKVKSNDEIGSLGVNFNNMLEHIERLHKQNMEKEMKIRDAQYRALQAQINPHFLYNTLLSIRWMAVMVKADNIKKAVDAFWKITKYGTDNNERFVTIETETNMVKEYITLQKIAYSNKFDVVWNMDGDVLNYKCMKFMLQPLVENSIIHGIFPEKKTGIIYISIYKENQYLVFNVYDDGVGMSSDTIDAVKNMGKSKKGKGKVGLQNIFERLEYIYGSKCIIDISSELGRYTNIMIKVPIVY